MVLNGNIVRFCHWCRQFYFCCLRKKIWLKEEKKSQTTKGLVVSFCFCDWLQSFLFDWCNGDNCSDVTGLRKKNIRATDLRWGRGKKNKKSGKRHNLLVEASANICMQCHRRGSYPLASFDSTRSRSERLRPQRRCHTFNVEEKTGWLLSRKAFLAALVTFTTPIDKIICTRGWRVASGANHLSYW